MNPDHEAYVDAALELNKMALAPDLRLDVVKQFELLARMKATLDSEPIPSDEESSNIFRL